MIFAFSTSSPVASVAVFTEDGELIFKGSRPSQMQASGVCFQLLEESGLDPKDGTLFVADIGPGSFTGTRVGVTIAKTLAFIAKTGCAGATAFDLIDPAGIAILPSRKGEWFVREPGSVPYRTESLPSAAFTGFGGTLENPIYPLAEKFGPLLPSLQIVPPEEFVPIYLIEPSISVQKKGLGLSGATS